MGRKAGMPEGWEADKFASTTPPDAPCFLTSDLLIF